MIWTRGHHKILKVAFSFWRSNQTIRKEHRIYKLKVDLPQPGITSMQNRYQLYTGCSDWTRITLRIKRCHLPKLDYTFGIETPLDEIMLAYIFGTKQKQPPEYCLFHIFVKEKDLKKTDKLQIDFNLISGRVNGLITTVVVETRCLNINTSIDKETVCVPTQCVTRSVLFLNSFNIWQTVYRGSDIGKNKKLNYHLSSFDLPIEIEILRKREITFRNASQLCDREVEFVTKRKAAIFEHMRMELGLQNLYHQKNAPKIAVIGSGGGMRAVIGMCGAMTALKDKGILDATMYTSGVSGSAWYLLALFSNDKQHKPEDITDIFRRKLQTFSKLQFIKPFFAFACQWMERKSTRMRYLPIDFSFTDTFGCMLWKLLNEKQEEDFWSKQADKLENGSTPLPLIAALHVRHANTVNDYHEWIEMSPYEAYIPKYGVAIDMKNFGDNMIGGYSLSNKEEMTIAFLQGMCGGGYAVLKNYKPSDCKWYMSWWDIGYRIASLFNCLDTIFLGKIPNVLYQITGLTPHDDKLGQDNFQNDSVDFYELQMLLVDAGIAFNSPYPTVLHPSREVDVIISLDFSNRYADSECPFGELELAAKWAAQKNIPFPKLYPQLTTIKEEWKQGLHEEVYIFPGDNSPTIVHFVMINKSFRKTDIDRHDFDILPHYSTLKFHYSEIEFDRLNSLIEHNVRANSEKIVDCIREVIDRKQKETQSIDKKNVKKTR